MKAVCEVTREHGIKTWVHEPYHGRMVQVCVVRRVSVGGQTKFASCGWAHVDGHQ